MEGVNRVSAGVIDGPAVSTWSDQGSILVIEDCEPLLFYLNSALLTLGYSDQHLASNLAEAQAVWSQHKSEISHIILNYELPDGIGFEFASRVLRDRPDMNIIVTSGYDISAVREMAGQTGRFHFLQKPFRLSELKQNLECQAEYQSWGV